MAKSFVGNVVSDKADKTIVVAVRTSKTHPLYRKQYTISKKFMVHDENNEASVGDRVAFTETRPISARKRFKLERILERARLQHREAAPEAPAEEPSEATSEEQAS